MLNENFLNKEEIQYFYGKFCKFKICFKKFNKDAF